jgi:large subunit ribosomal protein L2
MLKRIKSVTPGQRHIVRRKVDTEGGRKKIPLKLRVGKRNTGGRNQTGRITVHHRGGGVKRLRRKRVNGGRESGLGEVVGVQYDPNRTGRLARRKKRGEDKRRYKYVLAVEGLKVGDVIEYGARERNDKEKEKRESVKKRNHRKRKRKGSTKKLKDVEVGTRVCNVEVEPGKGGKYIRAAGGRGERLRKENGKVVLRRSTGKRLELKEDCTVTVGSVSGEEHQMEVIGKAGRNRRKGWRPKVRGEAMNPVDHPHGGRTRGGRREVTPWGRLAKGKKTRKTKKKSRWIVN